MKKRQHAQLTVLAGIALTTFAGLLSAQEEEAAVVEDPVVEATESEGTDTAEAGEEPDAAPVKPRPAEIARLAAKGLMLGVTNSGKHLFVVGDRGTVLVSNNSRDWAQVQTPVRSALTAVDFADESTGYAVGHDAVILKTSDGGKTWELQNFQPELEKPFLGILALDASNVIAVGAYGLMYRTSDGGGTWSEVDAPDIRGEELHLNGITRLDNGDLLVVGEQGTIGLSNDGGQTWARVESPYEGSLYGALPTGGGGALIYGLRGNAYRSDDVKAASWNQLDLGTVSSFFGGTVLSDGGVALVGLAGKVLRLDGSGAPSPVLVTTPQTDANGNTTDKVVTGSFSAAITWADRLILVGEQGVQSVKIN